MTRTAFLFQVALCSTIGLGGRLGAQEPTVDLSAYNPACGITVRHAGNQLRVTWPVDHATGQLELDLRPGQPLIRTLGFAGKEGEVGRSLIEGADPVTFLLVGSREAPAGRPPGMSVFNVFFDTPAKRPFQNYRSRLDVKRVRVASTGQRATITIGEITIGPFTGELRLTLYRGASLVHVETVVHTQEDRRAILYDTGLALPSAGKTRFAWIDTEGKLERQQASADDADRHLAVRHRTPVKR